MSDAYMGAAVARSGRQVSVERVGPQGMIALRGDLTSDVVAAAVLAATGLPVPAACRIEMSAGLAVAWMSPDELLLLLPQDEVAATIAALETALAGTHYLAVDVSDMRAMFRLRGAAGREVLAKLCPVDFSPGAFPPGAFRRTRAAQVAVAVWMSGADTFAVLCFRSHAAYMFDLLQTSARPGSEIGLY